MAWIVENRREAPVTRPEGAYLTEDMKLDLAKKYFPRYPTKRAVTLPALHFIQHTYGWIPPQALAEIADFLGQAPAEVLDCASFYEEFWLKPKGKYLIALCRSLSCELLGSEELRDAVQKKLGIEPGQTTADGRFTFVEVECLGACGTAPCGLCNDVLHENVTPTDFLRMLDTLPADAHQYHDPTVTWEDKH